MKRTLLRISLFITRPQHAALQQLAQRWGLPMAELIRRALDQYVQEHTP